MNVPSGSSSTNLPARIFVLNVLIVVILTLLLLYLFILQVVKGLEYQKIAKDITRREIPLLAQRGEIFDRNYDLPIVYNVDSYAIDFIPGDVPDAKKNEQFKKLSHLLNMDEEEIRKKVPRKVYHSYQPIEVKSAVPFEIIAFIAEHYENFQGVTWHNKPIRGYNEINSLVHLIGYVGDINSDELKILFNKGYNPNDTIGKNGIEKEYDTILKGKGGKRYKIVDVKEKQLGKFENEDIPPVAGKNIVLTIDRSLQKLCEKSLGDRNGCVIVLKPTTGEILAMVSHPWYDPTVFYALDGSEKFNELSLNPKFPFLNRAIQSEYPPASVFKTIMATALIEEKAIPLDETIYCTGSMELGNRVAHCWKETGHGRMNFFGGFANSCNIYFYTVGVERLKIDPILRYANEFGIGRPTGIDLPQEKSGFLPSTEWKEKKFNTKWFGGDTMNISIGQGFVTVTPLQIADVIAMIVNEGVVYKPYIVKEVRDPQTGDVITKKSKEVLLTSRIISKDTFHTVKQAMRKVITEGTGYFITTKAVEVAGKTGTPETGLEDKYHSWFASYAPYNATNPEDQIVIVSIIEASDEYEWWATKTVDVVYQGYFAHQTYEEAMVAMNPWMKKMFETPSPSPSASGSPKPAATRAAEGSSLPSGTVKPTGTPKPKATPKPTSTPLPAATPGPESPPVQETPPPPQAPEAGGTDE